MCPGRAETAAGISVEDGRSVLLGGVVEGAHEAGIGRRVLALMRDLVDGHVDAERDTVHLGTTRIA